MFVFVFNHLLIFVFFFRENKNVDEQKAKALIEQGKRELKHLQDMMNNKAFDEVN